MLDRLIAALEAVDVAPSRGGPCRSPGGWTIMETLIVIAIVLVLTATVGIMAFGAVDKARQVTAKGDIESFSIGLQMYYLDCGNYPTEEQGLAALWSRPSGDADGWGGPYVSKAIPKDPWGNDYLYDVPGPNGLPFGIRSLGSDGKEGGDEQAKDITSY
jgi:general secretion pathway protein G